MTNKLTSGALLVLLALALLLAGCASGSDVSRIAVSADEDDTNVTNLVASGYVVANDASVFTVPTAVATATPGFWVDNKGAGNNAVVVSKNATPVFTVSNGGRATTNGITNSTGTLILTAATSVTVTNGAAFAISGPWQPITASGAVTPTITIPAAGVEACIHNTSNQQITIIDTGNQVLTANFAMGQYDVLCGHSDGTRFIETSRANN